MGKIWSRYKFKMFSLHGDISFQRVNRWHLCIAVTHLLSLCGLQTCERMWHGTQGTRMANRALCPIQFTVYIMHPFAPFSTMGSNSDPNDLSASCPARKCPHRSLRNPSNRARPAKGKGYRIFQSKRPFGSLKVVKPLSTSIPIFGDPTNFFWDISPRKPGPWNFTSQLSGHWEPMDSHHAWMGASK